MRKPAPPVAQPCTHVWQHLKNRRIASERKPHDPALTLAIYQCKACPAMKTGEEGGKP